MIIDCQLKSLLKKLFRNFIAGFGQADAIGLSFGISNKTKKKCEKKGEGEIGQGGHCSNIRPVAPTTNIW